MVLSWLESNWLSLLICIIAGGTLVVTYYTLYTVRRVQFEERTCSIYRHDNENIIRIDAFALITTPYLGIECQATLKINHIVISLLGVAIKQQEGTSSPSGTYHIMMQSDKYEGELSGNGLLKLTLLSNKKKIKRFKVHISLAIPAYEPEHKP